jgi:hypothetical protein
MSLAVQSLKITSIEAARLWRDLQSTNDESEVDQILQSLWQAQTDGELLVDICADLADQIDAEIVAVKARMQHLVKIHQAAIEKLEQWRSRLDFTIVNLNEQGIIDNELIGQQRRITVKDNPPTCEVLVDPSQLPEEYQRSQVKVYANKKAITEAWKRGIPVEGTHIYCQRRVVYGLLKTNNFQEFQAQVPNNSTPSRHQRKPIS